MEPFTWPTGITGFDIQMPQDHEYIHLRYDGMLNLRSGYIWDFGSGPAIDTPDMVLASLVHDAFYELMNLELIPWTVRKKADKLLKQMLLDSGTHWLRAHWVYWAVRIGYPIVKKFGIKVDRWELL